ncbi:MAG: UPF0149 family protein [Rhodocyclaceae bacterium]|nr:UPF0149 family protein [Rhodocyclaceae bacterium]
MELFHNANPLSDAELDRLDDLLASEAFRGEAMRLDELQGLLCAVVSAPEPVMPSAWIPAALGVEPAYENEEQMREVTGLLMRYYDEVAGTLRRGEEPDLVLFPVDADADEFDYAAWADGYLYGTHLGEADWLDAAGDYGEDLSDLLEDFFLLNGAIKEDVVKSGETWMSAAAERQALAAAGENLPARVLAVYDFWQALRVPVATLRREAPKIGRNDRCSCGSGRKFKQCCGDPKKLH